MLRNADTAMYVAKARGKGRCEVFTDAMHEAVTSELALRNDLEAALSGRQFVVHYQPLLELSTEAVIGFEAVVRWQHPQRGLIAPADFLSLAHRAGKLHEIERTVLADACREAASWTAGPDERGVTVGVNLSPTHLQRPDLAPYVHETLARAGLNPDRLIIEVTESLDADDWTRVATTLAQLRRSGVRVALETSGPAIPR